MSHYAVPARRARREIFETAVTIPGLREPEICGGDDPSAPGSKSQLLKELGEARVAAQRIV
jgi:hypothetical protein